MVDYYVIGFYDGNGELQRTVCEEMSDNIYVGGRIERVGHCFESNAYHLQAWCAERGFGYYRKKMRFPNESE